MDIDNDKTDYGDSDNFTAKGSGKPVRKDDHTVTVTVATGGSKFYTSAIYSGVKWQTLYRVPVTVHWRGKVTETKEIDVNPDSSMTAGQTLQLNAKVRTKGFLDKSISSASWVDVKSDPETTWESSDRTIVDITPTGLITAKKAGTATIRATWRNGVYEISDSVTITVGDEPGPEPTPTPSGPNEYTITGDFDILPSNTINWRDTYTLRPKNFVIPNGCTYQHHEYQMISDGFYWYSGKVTSRTADSTYTYVNYPITLVVGSNNISIKIVADCDDSGWIADKVLTVNAPANNNPPVFNPGFFKQYDRANFNPISEIVVGSSVDLRIINNPMTDPAEPYDPDGDLISYTWDFAGSKSTWIQQIGEENNPYTHEESYNNILADELGTHCVYVTGRDPYGGSTRKQTCINVVPPNPVPIIDAPSEVVEGRPLAFPITGERSYSPMGRAIDHSKDLWTNKKDKYMTPGTETITLEVFDSAGLKSLAPAAHNLTVKPDLPPVPVLEFIPTALRNIDVEFTNKTYSPDYDQIVVNTVTYRYDSDNDGNFAEEISAPIMTDDAAFMFTPTKVGKYMFTVFAKEDWGKTATTDFILNVTNESPEVDFSALSVNPEPPEITVISPTMNTLMTSPNWKASSVSDASTAKNYTLDPTNNTLETGWVGYFQPYKAITTNNVSISTQEISRSYCGRCGNTGTTSGYYYNFDPSYRVDERLWSSGAYGPIVNGVFSGYNDFYDEDRAVVRNGYGYMNPVTSALQFNGDNGVMNVNKGLIWTRVSPNNNVFGYGFTWTDYIYRISDLKNYVPGSQTYENKVGIAPMNTIPTYISLPSGGLPTQLTPPAMPSSFTMPTPVINGTKMQVLKTGTNGTSYPSTTVQSNFNKDDLGNEYKNKCVVDTTYNSIKSCTLAKYNASGQVLWTAPLTFDYEAATIEYVSSDSTKIVVSYSRGYTRWILNNSDGTIVSTFSLARNSSFNANVYASYSDTQMLKTDGSYYLGVYHDVVAYISQTVEPGFMTIEGRKANWELKFYNLTTGETTSAGMIKSFAGLVKFYDSSNGNVSGNYMTAVPASVISADGKLIIANYYSNVLIYDMKTLAKEGDIPTGLADPQGSSNHRPGASGSAKSDSDGRYDVKGMTLTEDGRLKIVYHYSYRDRGCGDDGTCSNDERVQETAVTIQTTPSTGNSYSHGYISGSDIITNGDLSLKIKFNKNIFSDQNGVGIGFRSQDNKNMYKVEVSTGQVALVKIENGVRTILESYAYPIKAEQTYPLKVKLSGAKVKVYMNGVPIIEKTDSTFTSGAFGLFAEVPYAVLKDFSASIYEFAGDDVENVAIVNAPITYNKTYSDLENDPLIADKTTWKFTNIAPYKFLNVGDGTSDPAGTNSYNGIIVKQPSPSLSKVGVYSVDLVETDDPAPSGYKYPSTAFGEFQKESDPANHYIVVHRRPISDFTLSISPVDNTVLWTELGYDPDRWLSSANYSTEATGLDYKTTRGVMERRYYYIDPNGTKVNQKLVAPPIAGTYVVAETVRDEYGAWSEWAEQEITIIAPVINHPPAAEITMPTSADQSNPTKFKVLRPTFTWTYGDPDGDIQSQYELRIMRYGGTLLMSSGVKTGAATSWAPTADLPTSTYLYVQVRAYDGIDWSDWSAPKFFYINRPPIGDFAWTPQPVYEGDLVQFVTNVSDPDKDTLAVGYEITSPKGTKTAYSYTFDSPYSQHAGPSVRMVETGTWTIKMTINDAIAPAVVVTRTVQVQALGVSGAVKHTEAWDRNRIAYNEKYDPDRPSGTFWAGEAFVLEASATDTGASATKAASVTVRMFGERSKALAPTDSIRTKWGALLRSADTDIDFTELADGNYTFVFTATYTNGTVKTDAVTITIDDSVEAFVSVHRLQ